MNLDAYAPRHPDENYPQDLVDAEIEAIASDADRLHDAVCGDDDGAAYELAQLRIVLADANWLISRLAEGLSLDEAIDDKSRPRTASTFATLARTTKQCAELVDEKVRKAAAEVVHA